MIDPGGSLKNLVVPTYIFAVPISVQFYRVERPPAVHMSVSVRSVGAQLAFFDRHLKTHDRTFVKKYLDQELFLSSLVR
jgi:hypothetical protein